MLLPNQQPSPYGELPRINADAPVLPAMLRGLVTEVLLNAESFDTWSLQGLGMLRLYLGRELRLHVWDPREAFRDASKLHDHPWDFTSYVVLGRLKNIRYYEMNAPDFAPTHTKQTIVCGSGGCSLGDKTNVHMDVGTTEEYEAGESYSQRSTEVHESVPERGTVTIIQRTFHEDTEHATVFSPYGESWVSAEPRAATPEEVRRMTRMALMKWGTP